MKDKNENKNENKNNIENVEFNHEKREIAQWLEKVRFRKKFFGGVSEQDVWKKINELNEMYEEALKAERIRYEITIENYKKKVEANNNWEDIMTWEDKINGEVAHDE